MAGQNGIWVIRLQLGWHVPKDIECDRTDDLLERTDHQLLIHQEDPVPPSFAAPLNRPCTRTVFFVWNTGSVLQPTIPPPRLYDPSTFPPPSPSIPIHPFDSCHPPSTPPFAMCPNPTLNQSIWSRVGNVFRWPFSCRRHDDWLQPDLSYPPIWSPPPSSEESKSGYSSRVVKLLSTLC